MIAVGTLGSPLTVRANLNPQPDGTVTVSNTDGTVMSIQPDGQEQTRPAGTAGPFEKAVQNGNILTFFVGTGFGGTHAYPFALVETLPNV